MLPSMYVCHLLFGLSLSARLEYVPDESHGTSAVRYFGSHNEFKSLSTMPLQINRMWLCSIIIYFRHVDIPQFTDELDHLLVYCIHM
jgi:hypothetical protein